jgi:hypothetical protein
LIDSAPIEEQTQLNAGLFPMYDFPAVVRRHLTSAETHLAFRAAAIETSREPLLSSEKLTRRSPF